MINKSAIKRILIEKYGKKINKKAIDRLQQLLIQDLEKILFNASRKSDLRGRKIINENDLDE